MTWFVQSAKDPAVREGPFSNEVEAQKRARKLTKRAGSIYIAVDDVAAAESEKDQVPMCGPFRGPKGPVVAVVSGNTLYIESANGDKSGAIIMPLEVADRLQNLKP